MLMEAYGADVKKSSVFEWQKSFKEDQKEVKGDERTIQKLTG
jgi:hypothetical protein